MSHSIDAERLVAKAITRLLDHSPTPGQLSNDELLQLLTQERPSLTLSELCEELVAVERDSQTVAIFPVSEAEASVLIHCAPGWRLLDFARFIFSRRVRAEVLEPTIRDLQDEHLEALAQGRPRLARWVVFRGYYSFWSTVFAQIPVSFVRKVYDLWKAAGGLGE